MNIARTDFLRFMFSIKRNAALSTNYVFLASYTGFSNLRPWTSVYGGTYSYHNNISESGGLIFKVVWINYGREFYFLCLCNI